MMKGSVINREKKKKREVLERRTYSVRSFWTVIGFPIAEASHRSIVRTDTPSRGS